MWLVTDLVAFKAKAKLPIISFPQGYYEDAFKAKRGLPTGFWASGFTADYPIMG